MSINQASPIMATILYPCIRIIPTPKLPTLPTAKEPMEVKQRDIIAQMESFEDLMFCSHGRSLSRRNRPALPPEEEWSSHTDKPG